MLQRNAENIKGEALSLTYVALTSTVCLAIKVTGFDIDH